MMTPYHLFMEIVDHTNQDHVLPSSTVVTKSADISRGRAAVSGGILINDILSIEQLLRPALDMLQLLVFVNVCLVFHPQNVKFYFKVTNKQSISHNRNDC